MDDEPDRAYSRAPELEDLVALCRALREAGVRYLLIGGFAVILHGFVRTTKDIDLLVDPSMAHRGRRPGRGVSETRDTPMDYADRACGSCATTRRYPDDSKREAMNMQRCLIPATALLAVVALATAAHAQAQVDEGEAPAFAPIEAPAFTPVTAERLINAEDEPHNWLMYSGNYKAQRHTRLDEIDRRNVGGLEIAWVYQLAVLDRAETTPLVVDGVMYITESPSTVIAVDAATGRPYWRYEHQLPDELIFCCGRNNRGVAVQGDRVIMGTLDAHLVALDARTGSVVWETEVHEASAGYSKTAAPLIVGDKVFTGVAGGEYGIRGVVDAYDLDSGERAWRFYTTPGPDHPDNRSWSGDSWRTGGSATWMTGSYDPDLNLL